MTRGIRAIASTVLAVALIAASHSWLAGADEPEPESHESETEVIEETASDSPEATPTAAKPSPAKRSKKISKPFEPTERIEAESVISFPTNI
jgi:hypothetical protein